jgi:uncharacterized membrane protein
MIQYYRGEMHRANVWRIRLDTTTNWAIVTTAAILSFAFTSGPHVILLVGEMLVFHFLVIEARRYRFFDLWNTRVRKLEENFFAPLLRREDLESPQRSWGDHLAHDLFDPHYKVSFVEALGIRLWRNYTPVFGLLAALWVVKLITVSGGESFGAVYEAMAVGPIPSWFVLATFLGFHGLLLGIVAWVRWRPEHVSEEVEGIEVWPE